MIRQVDLAGGSAEETGDGVGLTAKLIELTRGVCFPSQKRFDFDDLYHVHWSILRSASCKVPRCALSAARHSDSRLSYFVNGTVFVYCTRMRSRCMKP